MNVDLQIQNGDKLYTPAVQEGITWTTERAGSPGKLQFKVYQDSILNMTEGNVVGLRVDGQNVFYGYIFSKNMDREHMVTVTAYDQLRYFKNKDTYVYEGKTAGELIQMICRDFNLNVGTIEDTGYKIPSMSEDDQTLFDIVQNALDATLQNQKNMYVMYDDYGYVALKSLASMKLNVLIDEETGQNYDYTSSIDENTYNRIKLVYDNEDTSQRDVYMAKDSANEAKWGMLQYFDTLKEGENGQAKADALLSLYNKKTRKLTIKGAAGDTRVRAGSLIPVMLDLGDVKLKNYMLVEHCVHTFSLDEHTMELKLRGGEFVT